MLFEHLYDRLHTMAGGVRGHWSSSATLQTTALVHEAYLKLAGGGPTAWEGRAHFLGVAAKAMRHILTDHARRRGAEKRGGGRHSLSIDESGSALHDRLAQPVEDLDLVLAIDDALHRLAVLCERESRVVECRFFGGLTVEETAAALNLSPATVKRDWALAQAWLYRELRL